MTAVRAVDWEGAIRAQRSRAMVSATTAQDLDTAIAATWASIVGTASGRISVAGLWLIRGGHVIDLSGVEAMEQALALARSEVVDLANNEPLVIIGVPSGQAS